MNLWIIIIILAIISILSIIDDIRQRQKIINLADEYDNLLNLFGKIQTYYNNMYSHLQRLDTMGGYETNDDFGRFFKYIKQSLLDIQDYFKES